MTNLEKAAEEYLARRRGDRDPDGYSEQGGHWYPNVGEKMPCCEEIKDPKDSWIYSLREHCKSLQHVAELYGVSENELWEVTKKERELLRQAEVQKTARKRQKKIAEKVAVKSPILRSYAADNIIRICNQIIRQATRVRDDYDQGRENNEYSLVGLAEELLHHQSKYRDLTRQEMEAEKSLA